ncbi:hypothetical protein F4819DRAFT_173164 [Hypoxylon fuscum]|nr:hypothetical protein F4819DRAFT_173164 [Hypoxylon fuscum]
MGVTLSTALLLVGDACLQTTFTKLSIQHTTFKSQTNHSTTVLQVISPVVRAVLHAPFIMVHVHHISPCYPYRQQIEGLNFPPMDLSFDRYISHHASIWIIWVIFYCNRWLFKLLLLPVEYEVVTARLICCLEQHFLIATHVKNIGHLPLIVYDLNPPT